MPQVGRHLTCFVHVHLEAQGLEECLAFSRPSVTFVE